MVEKHAAPPGTQPFYPTMNLKEIQHSLGVTADGILGPKTAAALRAAKYDVVLDAGHTSDHAREWPREWPAGTWDTVAGQRVLRNLNADASTKDSVEHMLNEDMATHTANALRAAGLKVLLYDDPTLGNKVEYMEAAKIAQAARPAVYLSIHNNGSKGVKGYETNTACGTVTFYRPGHAPSQAMAAALTNNLLHLRAQVSAPSNRADRTAPGTSYYVLNNTTAAGASCLVEVGFYDHKRDLEFMAENLREIGQALAGAIIEYLK